MIFTNDKQTGFFLKKYLYQNGKHCFITFQNGILFSDKHDFSMVSNLPISPVTGKRRQIENLFYGSNETLFCVTRNKIFSVSNNNLSYLPQNGIRGGTRFSAVFIFGGQLYVGTTFNGVYCNVSNSWKKINKGLPREKYSWGEYFYEEITDFFSFKGQLCCYIGNKHQIFYYTNNRWKIKADNITNLFKISDDVVCLKSDNSYDSIFSSTNDVVSGVSNFPLLIKSNRVVSISRLEHIFPYKKTYSNMAKKDLKALFVNLDYLKNSDIDVICKMFDEKMVNGVVINFKDDTGNLIFDPELAVAKEIGSAMLHYKLKMFLSKIRQYNPYVVARVVVFKDYRLFKFDNNKYALRDKKTSLPWKVNKIEYWVDPFSDFVVDYNVSVAKELERRKDEFMISEIQFDYIRMPSDKQVANAEFPFRKDGWAKYDVLENFLMKVTNSINIPFSLDIYGYNAIYKMGNVIGQDIETISKYAPVVCPMSYPSHFGAVYLKNKGNSQTYNILNFATTRANFLAYEGTIIRPYLQAFPYKVKQYNYLYIKDQLDGCEDGGAKGFSFWNPGSKYEKLHGFLKKINKKY